MSGKYTWSNKPNDEIWYNDRFDSIEECIKDAVENYERKPGEQIAIGICEDYMPQIDVETMLERAAEDAYEEVGEVAEGWLESEQRKGYVGEEKLQERIDKVFKEWLEETKQVPNFYKIHPLSEMVTIPEV